MNCGMETGFGFALTVRRDRLPRGAPTKHWHKERTQQINQRSRAARFENPIIAVKRNEGNPNRVWVHTSFQSASSCNIAHVNAINCCRLFAQTKDRGRNIFKRSWAIEMNESRQLCLQTHGKVDRLDHMIKNCNMCCRHACAQQLVIVCLLISLQSLFLSFVWIKLLEALACTHDAC